MSGAGGTIRGTLNTKTIGRGRLPDFDNSSSHIPRPKNDSSSGHTPGSDVGGSSAMSATSRQRQNQSRRDEVCIVGPL